MLKSSARTRRGASRGVARSPVGVAVEPLEARRLLSGDPTIALVKDIDPDPTSFSVVDRPFVALGAMYFPANDGVHGTELWRSDGTPEGTYMLKDIVAGPDSGWGVGAGAQMAEYDGRLYFWANDGLHGTELWSTDGTETGTYLHFDFNPGPASGVFSTFEAGLSVHGGKLFVNAVTPQAPTSALHWSDGEAYVRYLPNAAYNFTAADGWLYYSDNVSVGSTNRLYRIPTDGSFDAFADVESPSRGIDIGAPGGALAGPVIDGALYCTGQLGGTTALWRHDVASGVTSPFYSSDQGSVAGLSVAPDGNLIIGVSLGGGVSSLWELDLATVHATQLTDFGYLGGFGSLAVSETGPYFYFAKSDGTDPFNNNELWRTDGTAAGTVYLATFAEIGQAVRINGVVMFDADDGVNGYELWTTDGTPGGTVLLADLYAGPNPSYPANITSYAGGTFLTAWDDAHGYELRRLVPGVTLAGQDVQMRPLDTDSGQQSGVTLTYGTVAEPGSTTFSALQDAPPPPTGFAALDSALTRFDLSTTATFDTAVVAFPYDETLVEDESTLRLFHFEDGLWVDRTQSVDTDANVIYGLVSSFSPFALFQPAPPPRTVQIDVRPDSLNLSSNGVIPVVLRTTPDFDASTVDPATVRFAAASAVRWAMEDADGDGDLDMILHFRVQDTDLASVYGQFLADDANADGILDSTRQEAATSLTGRTVTDELFQGDDSLELFMAGKALRTLLDHLSAAGAI